MQTAVHWWQLWERNMSSNIGFSYSHNFYLTRLFIAENDKELLVALINFYVEVIFLRNSRGSTDNINEIVFFFLFLFAPYISSTHSFVSCHKRFLLLAYFNLLFIWIKWKWVFSFCRIRHIKHPLTWRTCPSAAGPVALTTDRDERQHKMRLMANYVSTVKWKLSHFRLEFAKPNTQSSFRPASLSLVGCPGDANWMPLTDRRNSITDLIMQQISVQTFNLTDLRSASIHSSRTNAIRRNCAGS